MSEIVNYTIRKVRNTDRDEIYVSFSWQAAGMESEEFGTLHLETVPNDGDALRGIVEEEIRGILEERDNARQFSDNVERLSNQIEGYQGKFDL